MLTTVYYLEMTNPAQHRPSTKTAQQALAIECQNPADGRINAEFYHTIGKHYQWTDRANWSPDTWKGYAQQPDIKTFIAHPSSNNKANCGYFELKKTTHSHNQTLSVEIVYFGLLPDFIGQGLGGALLSHAIQQAFYGFGQTADRIWLHTCSLDHAHALNNYQSRGFKLYKQEQETVKT